MLYTRDSSSSSPTSGAASAVAHPDSVPLYNQRAPLLALTISFLVVSWICSLLRLYARCVTLRCPGWDDFFVLLTMLSISVGSIVLCILPDLGLGRPAMTMTLPEVDHFLRVMYIGSASYPLSVTFVKLAILFQYLRIFKSGTRKRIVCKVLIVLSALWGVAFAILTFIPCWPVSTYWDYTVPDARCWGLGSRDLREFMNFFVGQAITTSVLDLIIFLLPFHLYFKPDTTQKTRLALGALFTLGLIVIMVSMWRMIYIIQMYEAGLGGNLDPTWYSGTAGGLACIEVHLATVCAALPVFFPVLSKWNRIFVTYTVSVTREFGVFPSKTGDVELQSANSDRNLTLDSSQMPESWEPFVGDETTGLGENETTVVSPAEVRLSRREQMRVIFKQRQNERI